MACPVRHHAEHGRGDFQLTKRFRKAAQDGRHVAGPRLWREVKLRRSNTEAIFNLIFAAQGEVSAHKLFNAK